MPLLLMLAAVAGAPPRIVAGPSGHDCFGLDFREKASEAFCRDGREFEEIVLGD